mmetsp:Transcript_37478/g.88754  ORF Transcript_37478/g.88754 Transcript_37478/m.88754 type:complete len:201 (+) Transcript_37478:47-649(+)
MSDAPPLPPGAPQPAAPPHPEQPGAAIRDLMAPVQNRQGIVSSPPLGGNGAAATNNGENDPNEDPAMEASSEKINKIPQSRLVFKIDKPDGLMRMLEIAQACVGKHEVFVWGKKKGSLRQNRGGPVPQRRSRRAEAVPAARVLAPLGRDHQDPAQQAHHPRPGAGQGEKDREPRLRPGAIGAAGALPGGGGAATAQEGGQ